jgi:23S rRNA (uridine2552-2'-O)-methyltransferase
MAGKRSKSSERWLRRQKKDYFVRSAQKEGVVSRAHYKLRDLDLKYGLVSSKSRVLELGAAPGGWSNYIESKLSNKGTLIAVDPLPITIGADTQVVVGCAGNETVDAEIAERVQEIGGLSLVLSDMAPNMTGVRAVDQARSMELADLVLTAAFKWLHNGGHMALKAFQGEGLDEWVAAARKHFDSVLITKPKSSRAESREVFVVARRFEPKRDALERLV